MAMNFKRAEELSRKITGAKMQIANGKSNPKDTKIGSMFAELKLLDEAEHARLFAEYTPVCKAYFEKQDALLEASNNAVHGKAKRLDEQ